MDDNAGKKAALYLRVGSKSAGFLLPDEREAFRAYMNQDNDKKTNRLSGTPDRNEIMHALRSIISDPDTERDYALDSEYAPEQDGERNIVFVAVT